MIKSVIYRWAVAEHAAFLSRNNTIIFDDYQLAVQYAKNKKWFVVELQYEYVDKNHKHIEDYS